MPGVITDIKAQEILTNIGTATTRVYLCVDNTHWGIADMPLGICNCHAEARVIQDEDDRFRGTGTRKAVANIMDIIRPALVGKSVLDQGALDAALIELDGTPDRSGLGGNTLYPVSLAAAKAAAASKGMPLYRHLNPEANVLPVPWVSLLVGGWQGDNAMDIQDISMMSAKSTSFAQAMEFTVDYFYRLKEVLIEKHGTSAAGFTMDGGFSSPVGPTVQALDLLMEALHRCGGEDLGRFHIDVAASNFYDPDTRTYEFEGKTRTPEGMLDWARDVSRQYPRVKVWEDVVEQYDVQGYRELVTTLPDHMIVGDDVFGTDPERIQRGFEANAVTAALCKIDQPGTLTQALEAGAYTRDKGTLVMSVRAVETEDNAICDASVALGAPFIKTAGIQGSERASKYNRLLEIEAELGSDAVYSGNQVNFDAL
ncbi:MAG: hypothetical protein MI863_06375 [Desulfobacterales bacterium]|nr:hypothetical protein [Desulfobacterales bacterium]